MNATATPTTAPTADELRAKSEAALREVLAEETDPRAIEFVRGLLTGDAPR